MKININQRCRVVLTRFGASHYNTHMQQYNIFYNKSVGQVLEGSMWDIMNIFGATLHNGMIEVPFKGCEMEILDLGK